MPAQFSLPHLPRPSPPLPARSFARAGPFTPDKPWLLEYFDQVQYFRVSEEELEDLREKFATGRYNLQVRCSTEQGSTCMRVCLFFEVLTR